MREVIEISQKIKPGWTKAVADEERLTKNKLTSADLVVD
jgi:hypothetical protein